MRRIVAALDERWLRAANSQLSAEVGAVLVQPERTIRHLLLWAGFFPGEPDLSDLIDHELGRRVIYLPVLQEKGTMEFVSIARDWRASAVSGAFQIPEPAPGSGARFETRWAQEAAVIVPGLAFDRSGNRLGRGGGHYDRFLARPGMDQALKIGACWSLQLVDEVPVEDHDIGVDWVCHERGTLRTGIETSDDFDEDGEDE